MATYNETISGGGVGGSSAVISLRNNIVAKGRANLDGSGIMTMIMVNVGSAGAKVAPKARIVSYIPTSGGISAGSAAVIGFSLKTTGSIQAGSSATPLFVRNPVVSGGTRLGGAMNYVHFHTGSASEVASGGLACGGSTTSAIVDSPCPTSFCDRDCVNRNQSTKSIIVLVGGALLPAVTACHMASQTLRNKAKQSSAPARRLKIYAPPGISFVGSYWYDK